MDSKLSGKEDEIIDKIIEGLTFKQIAEGLGCSATTLHRFLVKEDFSARARDAMQISASSYADKAEEVLILAEKNSIEMTRARELAQHYRWKAGKRNPRKYGDKKLHGSDPDNPLPNNSPEKVEVIFRDFSKDD